MVLTNTLRHDDEAYDTFVRRVQTWDFFSLRRQDSVTLSTGTSILIMLAGMLVPVLAAAPFYIADRRRDAEATQADTEPEKQTAEPEIQDVEQEEQDAEIIVLHPESPSANLETGSEHAAA